MTVPPAGQAKARCVERMFSRIVPRYDLMNTLMTGGRMAAWRRMTARTASAGRCGDGLDVATGTGDLAFALASQPGIERVVGVDFCADMVYAAQGKVRQRGLQRKVELVVGDGLCLPFADASFVCATIGFGLRNVSDIPQALSEMCRVLAPGGRVAILELTPLRPGFFATLFRWYLQGIVPVLGRLLARDYDAYAYLFPSMVAFPPADELCRMMESVGLREVSYRRLALGAVAMHVGTR